MMPLRIVLLAICACLLGSGLDSAWAEVPVAQSSSISRIDLKITEWFSQGETVWSHNASGLDPNLGNPSSKLKYKDTGTNVTEITGIAKLIKPGDRVDVIAVFDAGGGKENKICNNWTRAHW